jgi:hypothetical protein
MPNQLLIMQEHFFSDYGTLTSGFVSDSTRGMNIWLYEDDITNDDFVKLYSGSFTGRRLTSIVYSGGAEYKEIEDDQYCEFYIKAQPMKRSGDKTKNIVDLFKYDIVLD